MVLGSIMIRDMEVPPRLLRENVLGRTFHYRIMAQLPPLMLLWQVGMERDIFIGLCHPILRLIFCHAHMDI